MGKVPFDIDDMIHLLREAVRPFPPAALFQLYDEGHTSAFEQLLACIVSIRTRDEATVPIARRLFARARTPAAVLELSVEEIERLIRPSTFHGSKALQIREIARRVLEEHAGVLPCDGEVLMSFPGVGLKCANLVLGIACSAARVSADVHVHRVTNRWGYVATSSPEATSRALEENLPERYRVEINRLLVPFGKHICTGVLPRCSSCPVLEYCRQVGVRRHR